VGHRRLNLIGAVGGVGMGTIGLNPSAPPMAPGNRRRLKGSACPTTAA
jgi:hypothetical protein